MYRSMHKKQTCLFDKCRKNSEAIKPQSDCQGTVSINTWDLDTTKLRKDSMFSWLNLKCYQRIINRFLQGEFLPVISRVATPFIQLPIYKAIYRGCNSIYN